MLWVVFTIEMTDFWGFFCHLYQFLKTGINELRIMTIKLVKKKLIIKIIKFGNNVLKKLMFIDKYF